MDFITAERELRKLSATQRRDARNYARIRHDYGQARWSVIVLLAAKQSNPDYRKSSFEKQVMMLLNECPENQKEEVYGYVRRMTELEQDYKGMKLLIEATGSRISQIQSLMRYQREND